ncbi:hypothetical protein [Microbacterium sp. RURRCA19A]|uniref:hypothetical protein n=1 Tax=Microbacterium sp. RURRCA19A TaxID=1907391 RepID=UPI0020CA055E|nr:hypothetical protein [Microbacterium sp. RURRCA19A]
MVQRARSPLILFHCPLDALSKRPREGFRHLLSLPETNDRIFQPGKLNVRGIAQVFLTPPAEEVLVVAASPAHIGHDHPADRSVRVKASPTEQAAFQVMIVRAPALPRALRRDHLLHPREHFAVDQSVVPPLVDLILQARQTEVVRVLEQAL